MDEKFIVNGQEMTKEEFEEFKTNLKKGQSLVECGTNEFKTRLQD
jgi:hypothetical protein